MVSNVQKPIRDKFNKELEEKEIRISVDRVRHKVFLNSKKCIHSLDGHANLIKNQNSMKDSLHPFIGNKV